MSLLDLVSGGMRWIEAQSPQAVSINGGEPVAATVDFIGLKDAFGDDTRQREQNFDATVVIRRTLLGSVPVIGGKVSIGTRTFRIFEVREDELSITLLVDSLQR